MNKRRIIIIGATGIGSLATNLTLSSEMSVVEINEKLDQLQKEIDDERQRDQDRTKALIDSFSEIKVTIDDDIYYCDNKPKVHPGWKPAHHTIYLSNRRKFNRIPHKKLKKRKRK